MDRAGVETMLMNYYRHIDRTEVQFDFLCNKAKPGAYDGEIRSLGGRIFRTPGLNPLKYPQYLSYMRRLFTDYPEYQIVEAHNGAFGVYALYAAKINRIPNRIFHAHGASIARDWKLPWKLVCRMLLPFYMNQRFTCGIAAANCYFGRKVVESGGCELIPNAIEVERFRFNEAARTRMRKENGLNGKHVIGHAGRFMAQKNHAYLLEVFSNYCKHDQAAHLVLLGDGELMDKMKAKARKLGIAGRVTFAGNVSNVNEWCQAFDCFVLPSVWEGLPVAGVEAQAADLPCIFSDSVTPEIQLTGKAVFVSLTAPVEQWTAAVQNALQLTKRQDNTQLMMDKGYNIKTEAAKLQARYLRLAGGSL